MALDTSKAGQLVAEQMEAIEKDYADQEGFELGAIVTIVEVAGPDGSLFRMRNNIGNPVLVLGVIRMAENQMLNSMRSDPS